MNPFAYSDVISRGFFTFTFGWELVKSCHPEPVWGWEAKWPQKTRPAQDGGACFGCPSVHVMTSSVEYLGDEEGVLRLTHEPTARKWIENNFEVEIFEHHGFQPPECQDQCVNQESSALSLPVGVTKQRDATTSLWALETMHWAFFYSRLFDNL